jgi:hypothetical protein
MTLILTTVSLHHSLSMVPEFSVSSAPALWAGSTELAVARLSFTASASFLTRDESAADGGKQNEAAPGSGL